MARRLWVAMPTVQNREPRISAIVLAPYASQVSAHQFTRPILIDRCIQDGLHGDHHSNITSPGHPSRQLASFVKLATLRKGQSYTVHLDCNDTYRQFSLGGDAAGKALWLIVSSDDCVDNKKIVIREVDGGFKAEMKPRGVMPSSPTLPAKSTSFIEPPTKRSLTFWRLWVF